MWFLCGATYNLSVDPMGILCAKLCFGVKDSVGEFQARIDGFTKLMCNGEVDRLTEFIDENVSVGHPLTEPMIGRDAVLRQLREAVAFVQRIGGPAPNLRLIVDGVTVSGRYAIVHGTWRTENTRGCFLTVWKLSVSGNWIVHNHITNVIDPH